MAGYDCKFVKPPPDAFQTECPVCLNILNDPYQTKCCGNCFCRSCYERLQSTPLQKLCPTCKSADFTAFRDQRLHRALTQLEVFCTHKDRGCKWTGELGNLARHLNENPRQGAEKDGCDFAQVQCPHCQVMLERRLHKISRAHFDSCPKLRIPCTNRDKGCDWHGELGDIDNHLQTTCIANFRDCPNKCGQRVHHSRVNNHREKECAMTVIDCDFKSMGCKEQLPRKDMPNHLNEGLHSHMLLLMERNRKLEEENAALMKQAAAETKEVKRIKANVDRVQRDKVSKTEVREIQQEMRSKVSMKWLVLVSAIVIVGLALLLKIQLRASKADLQKELVANHENLHEQITNVTQNVTSFQKEHIVAYCELQTQLSNLTDLKKELDAMLMKLQTQEQSLLNIIQNITHFQTEHTSANSTLQTQLANLRDESRENATSINKTLNESRKELRTRNTELQNELQQQAAILNESKTHVNYSMVQLAYIQQGFTLHEFTLTEFKKCQAQGGYGIWYSEPFYSHPGGYRFKLRVDTNGYHDVRMRSVYVSVCFYLLKGNYDNHKLDWPVTATAHVQLLNQLGDHNHHEMMTPSFRWGKTHRYLWGMRIEKFIKITDLELNADKNIHYLKDDCLNFRVYIKCTESFTEQAVILNNFSIVQLAEVNRTYIQQGFTLHNFTLTEFKKCQAKGGYGNWWSEPFYSHPGGYKFKLNVETNGDDGIHMRVWFKLLKGDHDYKLDWPVTVTAHVQLLNQLGDHNHHEVTSTFNQDKRDWGWKGRIDKFIKHTDLGLNADKNIQYLKDDRLYFRVYIKCTGS